MRKGILLSLVLLQAGPAAAEDKLPDGTLLRDPVTFKNLTLIPLVAVNIPKTNDFLVLDEGMEKGLVAVKEEGRGGSVNELELENRSDKPLFLMAGEVVLGGQQDRIIGRDTIVPPKKKQKVPVFCVEHGRWAGADKRFRTGKALAHTKLRKQANFAGQGEVWNEVADKNKKRKTENATDTYRDIAEKGGEKDVAAYTAHFTKALAAVAGADQMVGFAVAVNGQVVAIEQFASPALYKKIAPKLLRSYYVDAIDAPVVANAKPPAPRDVGAFIAKEKEAPPETVLDAPDAKAKTEHIKARGFRGSKVTAQDADAKPVEVYKSYHQE